MPDGDYLLGQHLEHVADDLDASPWSHPVRPETALESRADFALHINHDDGYDHIQQQETDSYDDAFDEYCQSFRHQRSQLSMDPVGDYTEIKHILSFLSVNVWDYVVEGSSYGDQVGDFRIPGYGVDAGYERKTCRTELHPVRELVSMAFYEYAEFSAAAFHGGIPAAFRKLDDRLHFHLVFSLRNVVDELFHDLEALLYFLHPHRMISHLHVKVRLFR